MLVCVCVQQRDEEELKMKLFKFKITKQELKDSIKPKKIFFTVVGALILKAFVFPIFNLPGEWELALSVAGAVIIAEWLD